MRAIARPAAMALALGALAGANLFGQTATPAAQAPPARMDAADLKRAHGMLEDARDAVKRYYYDRAFHGVDLDARFKEYEAQLNAAPSLNVGMTIVAAYLEGLHDSHVYFQPPPRPFEFDYGYRLIPVGEDVFVRLVRPGSDAAGKLAPGDRVMLVNNGRAARSTFHTMEYLLQSLQPQPATQLVVRDPAGRERTVLVTTEITDAPRRGRLDGSAASIELDDILRQSRDTKLTTNRSVELGDVLVWQIPSFFGSPGDIDDVFRKAKTHRALVLDLRGSPGGYATTMARAISHLFQERVILGRRVERDRTSEADVDGRKDAFTGPLVVLIDARSSSAAEILARVVQLEHRGVVIGDRSAGAVMEARAIQASRGTATLRIFYAFSVTVADLIMTDGHSLEGTGVAPDERILPTGEDLALGRDPVLSRAAKLVGLDLDPVAAGKLFPVEWK